MIGFLEVRDFIILGRNGLLQMLDFLILLLELMDQLLVLLLDFSDLDGESLDLLNNLAPIVNIDVRVGGSEAGITTALLVFLSMDIRTRTLIALLLSVSSALSVAVTSTLVMLVIMLSDRSMIVVITVVMGQVIGFLEGLIDVQEHHLGAVKQKEGGQNVGKKGGTTHL